MKTYKRAGKYFSLALLLAAGCATEKITSRFVGTDLSGWRQPAGDWKVARSVSLDPSDAAKFVVTPGTGIFVNGNQGKTSHFITEAEFGDANIHIEFCIPKNSSSGAYVMARYEVQVYDSFGVAQDKYPGIECGGIYPRWINEKNIEGHSPRVNTSQPPGVWQTYDITF